MLVENLQLSLFLILILIFFDFGTEIVPCRMLFKFTFSRGRCLSLVRSFVNKIPIIPSSSAELWQTVYVEPASTVAPSANEVVYSQSVHPLEQFTNARINKKTCWFYREKRTRASSSMGKSS